MKGGLSPPHGNSPPFQKNVSRETSVTNVSRETYFDLFDCSTLYCEAVVNRLVSKYTYLSD